MEVTGLVSSEAQWLLTELINIKLVKPRYITKDFKHKWYNLTDIPNGYDSGDIYVIYELI